MLLVNNFCHFVNFLYLKSIFFLVLAKINTSTSMKTSNLTIYLLLLLSATLSFSSFAQENVLPENGNVGLGTLNPSAKLDVNGNVHIDSMLMVKDSILIQKNARIQNNLTVEQQVKLPNLNQSNGLETDNILLIDENGGLIKEEKSTFLEAISKEMYKEKVCSSDGLVYDPVWMNGTNKIFSSCPEVNVGINTTEPRVKLDVIGAIYSSRIALGSIDPVSSAGLFHARYSQNSTQPYNLFNIENADGKLFQINNNGTALTKSIEFFEPAYNSSNALLIRGNYGYDRFSVDYAGRLSATKGTFHTSEDDLALEVRSVFFDELNERTFSVSGKGTVECTKMKIANSQEILFDGTFNQNSSFNSAIFQIQNLDRKIFQINNNGLVQAREIKVDLASWPDYVFKDAYHLMPLQQVEVFIKENGHLPNVPKAITVESDGLNLGEISKISIEKIEELTLHAIEQQKIIESLLQNIDKQNQRIEELEKKIKK